MPPRPRAPRPRVSTIRRPRVAGTAPAAQRTTTTTAADRSVPDDTHTRPIPLAPRPVVEPSAPSRSDLSPAAAQPEDPAAGQPAAERPAPEGSVAEVSAPERSAPGKPARSKPVRKSPSTQEAASSRGQLTLRRPTTEELLVTRPGQTLRKAPAGETAADLAPDSGSKRSMRVPLLAAALVVLTGLAVFFGIEDARLRGTPAAANSALVDVGTTAEVSGQLTDALQTIYSYDFARLDENERAARAVITPEFADQFNRLFAQVRELAPQQQAVVSATVTLSAVKEITGDRAVLVAFMDQQATRAAADDGQPTQLAAAGRLTVTGQKIDGRWKIAAVESK
jgi:Mce-associated membrane protein